MTAVHDAITMSGALSLAPLSLPGQREMSTLRRGPGV